VYGEVVLHPLAISRTDLSHNPSPGVVAWAGPLVGVGLPMIGWLLAAAVRMPGTFLLRFFAAFCLVANGLYIGLGSFGGVGDAGQMLRHGSQPWHLWLFGLLTVPIGLWLWHRQGTQFGLGQSAQPVGRGVALGSLAVCVLLVLVGLAIGRSWPPRRSPAMDNELEANWKRTGPTFFDPAFTPGRLAFRTRSHYIGYHSARVTALAPRLAG
jgi:hypothetical protein